MARLIQFVAAARYNIESQANIFSLVIFTSILKSIKITYRFPSTSILFFPSTVPRGIIKPI